MLRRNISVEAGLVNGAVGTVTGFVEQPSDQGTNITAINIQFENIFKAVKIERQSVTFEVLKSIFFTRKQFPIVLAFAISIHKSQGLSLKRAIVDVCKSCFGTGMAYVALSRVTSLNGLHIIDLSRDKIVANRSALDEYSRLRSLYTPHLAGYPVRETAKSRDKKPTKRKMPHTSTMEETMPAVPTAACVMSNSNDTTLQTATTSTTRDNTVIILSLIHI